jgi:hypothetical protein
VHVRHGFGNLEIGNATAGRILVLLGFQLALINNQLRRGVNERTANSAVSDYVGPLKIWNLSPPSSTFSRGLPFVSFAE